MTQFLNPITAGTWQGSAVGLAYGGTGQTTANGAFNALAPSQSSNSGKFLTTDGTDASWSSAAMTYAQNLVQGRLSLTSGTPVTTSDVTAATAVYFSPYCGNQIAIWYGTSWNVYTFSTIGIASPPTSKVADIFAYWDGAAVSLARINWANTTTRATGLTTKDGVLVSASSNGYRYLGTVYYDGSSQTNDSMTQRHVWNYYNRIRRSLRKNDSTSTWTLNSASFRAANNSSSNNVSVVVGYQEAMLDLTVTSLATGSTTMNVQVSIGEDSTTASATEVIGKGYQAFAGAGEEGSAFLSKYPTIGLHTYYWIEATKNGGGGSSGTATIFSNTGTDMITNGLSGWIEG